MLLATDLLKAALVCASSEETRYYLRGVHLATSGHLVTTDGHRMFVARLAERPATDVIVPYDAVAAALKLAGARCKEIEIDLAVNRIGQIQFTPVDGTFPDWRRIVPTGEETPSTTAALYDGAEHVHFNNRYVGEFEKMADILCGKSTTGQSVLHPRTASDPCLVTFGDRADCFGVIMPVRRTIDRTAVLTRNVVMAG
jgi:DNA polymerase III sliding clamp (beta) subunit (PCNA family)